MLYSEDWSSKINNRREMVRNILSEKNTPGKKTMKENYFHSLLDDGQKIILIHKG